MRSACSLGLRPIPPPKWWRSRKQLRSRSGQVVIIVTSKPHTRRVRYLWKRLVGDNPRLIVRYASDDSFDAGHWWRSTKDGLDVVREVLGLANATLGFPARAGQP